MRESDCGNRGDGARAVLQRRGPVHDNCGGRAADTVDDDLEAAREGDTAPDRATVSGATVVVRDNPSPDEAEEQEGPSYGSTLINELAFTSGVKRGVGGVRRVRR